MLNIKLALFLDVKSMLNISLIIDKQRLDMHTKLVDFFDL